MAKGGVLQWCDAPAGSHRWRSRPPQRHPDTWPGTKPSLLLRSAEWTSPRVPNGGRLDSVASTFAEGLRRLRELCAQPPSGGASMGARAAHTARTELLKVLEAAPVPWRRLSQAEGGAERRMIHASTAAPFPGVTETGVQ